jgi:hypothetical protein
MDAERATSESVPPVITLEAFPLLFRRVTGVDSAKAPWLEV